MRLYHGSKGGLVGAIELTEGVYRQYRRDGLFFDEFFEKYAERGLPCS